MPPPDGLRGEVTVAELQAGDARSAAGVAALLNGELGEGLYGAEGLLIDAADPRAAVLVAEASGLIGAAVSRVLRPADLGYYERFGAEGLRLSIGLPGSLEALAVEPGFRRRGAGRLLAQASLSWMRAQGCDLLVTLAWRSGREDESMPLFRRLGFHEGPTVDRFYLEESLRDGWSCPVCGPGCRCAATLFTLPLVASRRPTG
jgi:GNAT superfamily N-acetyltransferase